MADCLGVGVARGMVGMALVAVALGATGCQSLRRYVCPEMRNEDCVRDAYRQEGRLRRDTAMTRLEQWNDQTRQVMREYDEFMDEREQRIRRTR